MDLGLEPPGLGWLSVLVVPGEVGEDRGVLLGVGPIVGAVEGERAERLELALDEVEPRLGYVGRDASGRVGRALPRGRLSRPQGLSPSGWVVAAGTGLASGSATEMDGCFDLASETDGPFKNRVLSLLSPQLRSGTLIVRLGLLEG